MAFDLACPADLSVLRIEGTDSEVLWSEVVDHAGGVDVDGGGDPVLVSTFVTEHVEGAVYQIHKNVEFGDGANALTFVSKNEMVFFDNGINIATTQDYSTLQLGELADGYGINGSFWSFGPSATLSLTTAEANFLCYASRLHCRTAQYIRFFTGNNIVFNKSMWSGESGAKPYVSSVSNLSINDLYMNNVAGFYLYEVPDPCTKLHIHKSGDGLKCISSPIFTGTLVTASVAWELDVLTAGDHPILRDSVVLLDSAKVRIGGADSTGTEDFSCDIRVIDSAGDGIQTVSVACERASIVRGTNTKTYKCHTAHTADADKKPITGGDYLDYWVELSVDDLIGEDNWYAGATYDSADSVFSGITTDSNGDLSATQHIPYRVWSTTDENLEMWVHKFTFTHNDYPDFTMVNILANEVIDWRITLDDPKYTRSRTVNLGRLGLLR